MKALDNLVPRNGVLGDIFEPGVEIWGFSNVEEAAEKAPTFSSSMNKARSLAVAWKEHRRAMAEHTFRKRIKSLLDFLS